MNKDNETKSAPAPEKAKGKTGDRKVVMEVTEHGTVIGQMVHYKGSRPHCTEEQAKELEKQKKAKRIGVA